MNILRRTIQLLRGSEKRSRAGADPYLAAHQSLRSGAHFGAATSLAVADACIRLIAESTASVPLMLYRRETKTPAVDHPLYDVLHDRANEVQTAVEFREQLAVDVLTTGNGYARKILNAAGQVAALIPMRAAGVSIERLPNGRLRYVYQRDTGGTETLLADEVLHIRYRAPDGVQGISPIEAVRPTFDLALRQQEFATDFLERSGRPSGVFKMPNEGALEDDAFERLKISLRQAWSAGTGNPVLEQGLEFQQVSLSPRDSQFIEQVRMTGLDICRVYRVPPPSVGILDNATYSNITEQSAMLVKHCLRPWMVRIEQAMSASLLTARGRRIYSIEHNAEGLLRGSQKERFEAYRIAREWGWLNTNEIRRLENLQGIGTAGDEYRVPMNSQAAGDVDAGDVTDAGAGEESASA